MAYVTDSGCTLISRRCHAYEAFASLAAAIAAALRNYQAVLDGEIVCLDEAGDRSSVNDETIQDLMLNIDHEIRLIAELDGKAFGIGALILERSELRACYCLTVICSTGLWLAIGSRDRATRPREQMKSLSLAASLNAEAFYSSWVRGPREKRRLCSATATGWRQCG